MSSLTAFPVKLFKYAEIGEQNCSSVFGIKSMKVRKGEINHTTSASFDDPCIMTVEGNMPNRCVACASDTAVGNFIMFNQLNLNACIWNYFHYSPFVGMGALHLFKVLKWHPWSL